MDTTDFLEHHGVLGMKWGKRKDRPTSNRSASNAKPKPKPVLRKKLKSGETVSIYRDPPSGLPKLFPSLQDKTVHNFTIRGTDGKRAGEATFIRRSQNEMYLEWIGINRSSRGKGYASAALEGVKKYAQSEGVGVLKLEVPGNSPDARHIYEKLGFKEVGTMSEKDTWGGLTEMELHLKHEDNGLEQWEIDFADELFEALKEGIGTLEHSGLRAFLKHHGVKGMKWGRRKDEAVLRRLTGGNQMRAQGGTKEERKAVDAEDKAAWKKYKSETTGKERRADRKAATAAKGAWLIEEAMKKPDFMVQTRDLQGMPVMMLGSEFIEKVSKGAAFNAPYTDFNGMYIDRSKQREGN